MRYRQLGRSGLFVSEICLGAMTFGGGSGGIWSMIGDLDQQAVNAVMSKALQGGVNFIDTADVYSQGVSERLVGQSLKDLGVKRSDVVIATKVYGDMGNGPNDRGASRGHIMDGVQASLERLGPTTSTSTRSTPTTRSRRSTRRCARSTTSCARAWCATSAAPTGPPGRSPSRWGSATTAALRASRPCRPTTRSPGATWSARSCR